MVPFCRTVEEGRKTLEIMAQNGLTQLALGLDRDSGIVSHISNENDPAVRKLIEQVVEICRSLNPDTVIKTIKSIAEYENRILRS